MRKEWMFFKMTAATVLWIIPAMVPLKASAADQTAVIATVAADYSSAAHSVVSMDPAGGPRTVQNNLAPTATSDITVAAHGNYFYRIERFQADNVTKFSVAAPADPIWQFSTMDPGEEGTSNPHDLIFVDDRKAYLLRYGKTTAWIVNPSATDEAGFKIGELDLSAYADSDGIPEMNTGLVADGKLFITLQRLDRDNGFLPSNDGYVAVFDTATDTEIGTGASNPEGLPGIRLPIRNLGAIQYLEENDSVYVQGVGDYGSSWTGRDPEYSGGIVRIDPATYSVAMVVDDGDAADHPYGNISGMGIVSADKGYFVGYAGFGDNTLYAFDPATGAVFGAANDQLAGKNITGMEAGAFPDANGLLWVSDATDARVVILNPADDTIDDTVSTGLNPTRIVFAGGEPAADEDSDSGGGGGGCFIGAAVSF
jgi:hypothetical protein